MHGSMAVVLRFLLALLAALALAGGATAATFGGKRVALVIGNGKYPSAPLKNPVNDAKAMARTLKDLGFEVTLRENAGQRDMAAAIRQFGASIAPGSAALFYFAGHGMQVKGRNYLVPTDADIQLEDEVPYAAIDVNLVLDKMEVGKSAVNLVILDACRNNPFSRRFRSSGTGLAQMDAPVGTLIAFATAPGSVAQDGTGENGIYTKHLLDSIAMPGLPVEQMFKRVRVGVARETNEAQIPWESSSMKGDFVFREAPSQPALSQDKLIEEAARAAAERAAALTAERLQREQAARAPQQDRARAELDSLNAERENLLRERERLAAENEALRRKAVQAPAQAPVALAAPAPVQARPAPVAPQAASDRNLPMVGNRWTYRYTDLYGKSETYTVTVTASSAAGITDEIRAGKIRHAASFEEGLALVHRKLGSLQLREVSPYLPIFGLKETPAWKEVEVFEGKEPFKARLAGAESVKVPAGTFEAQKVVIEGNEYGRIQTQVFRPYTITAWYAPAVRRVVKMTFVGAPAGLFPAEQETIELIETNFPVRAVATVASTVVNRPPTTLSSLTPVTVADTTSLPQIGDTWTYRYTDKIYGKSETYTVRVTSASADEIADEARIGKDKHAATFENELALIERRMGKLPVRELSPYLLSRGPLQARPEWGRFELFPGRGASFRASLAGTESVKVPAGTFEAHKLVILGDIRGSAAKLTAWYATAMKRLVKMEIDVQSGFHVGRENEMLELTEYRLQ